MTKLKLASKLPNCDKPDFRKTRHKVSKKDIEEYYKIEPNEEIIDEE